MDFYIYSLDKFPHLIQLLSYATYCKYLLKVSSTCFNNIYSNISLNSTHDTCQNYVIYQVHSSGKYISTVHSLPMIKACLPQQPSFSQHALRQCCNYLGIPSSTAEILLFNLVFHDRVTPVVVATTCWNSTYSILTSAKLSVGYLVL